MSDTRKIIEKVLEKGNGILKLKPAWVSRDFLPPGKRLGLKEEEYNKGKEGFICERWLASVTKKDSDLSLGNEGLSYLNIYSGYEITLKEAIALAPDLIMGKEYCKNHSGLGRLAKIYDFGSRIGYHLHQMEKDAKLVGANSKDEAYYFPEGIDLGSHPETFFGVHPYIVNEKKYDIILPYLVSWKDDLILQHSRAYLNVPGEGFFLPSGILHAPGTALTIELQEDSDVYAILQALNAGKIVSKDLLFKDIRKDYKDSLGEKAIIDQIDWPANGDPYFYENHHIPNILIEDTNQKGGSEHWIYYNTTKFSGKRLIVKAGNTFTSKEKGVYNILVWKGQGFYDGNKIEAGNFDCDELLISYDRAIRPLTVKNTGKGDLQIIKFFGPDINTEVPFIKQYNT
jgi:hypothetical protein